MFEIEIGDEGIVILDGRLDAAQAVKAQVFLDQVVVRRRDGDELLRLAVAARMGVFANDLAAGDGHLGDPSGLDFTHHLGEGELDLIGAIGAQKLIKEEDGHNDNGPKNDVFDQRIHWIGSPIWGSI